MLISMMLLGVLASIDPLRPAVFALVLSTRRQNAMAFLIGWMVALSLLFGLAFIALGADASQPPDSTLRTWASALLLVIGLALLIVAARRWLRRDTAAPRGVVPEALVRRLESLNLRRAGVLGVLIQPRALTIAAALVCARDRTGAFNLVIGFAVFAVVSTGALIALLVYDARHPAQSQRRLTAIVERIEREAPRLVTIGSAVAGIYLVVDSIVDLVEN